MNGRLDPPPVTPPVTPPRPPAPPKANFGPAMLIGLLVAIALLVVVAWKLMSGGGSGGGVGGFGGPSIAIPSEMGSRVPVSAVNALFEDAQSGDLNGMGLRLVVGQAGANPVYRVGDQMRVGFSSGEEAACVLFHRDATGSLSVQYPGRGETSAVKANADWVSAGFNITPPVGKESFLLVCTRPKRDGGGNLATALERPRAEWRRALAAARADFEVRQ
jgi:hypothetical protein